MKWSLVALVLCTCPGPAPGPCPTELVLGTETDGGDFLALTEGADLKINRGPQGGWHVWVSVQAATIPSSGTLTWVLRSDTQQVLSAPLRLSLPTSPVVPITCGWERRSDALVFMGNGEPFRGTNGELEVSFGTITVKRKVRLF